MASLAYTIVRDVQQSSERLIVEVEPDLFNYQLSIIPTNDVDFPAILNSCWSCRVINIGTSPVAIADHRVQQLSPQFPTQTEHLDLGLFDSQTGAPFTFESPIEPSHQARFSWRIGIPLTPYVTRILKDQGSTSWYQAAAALQEAQTDLCGNILKSELITPGIVKLQPLDPEGIRYFDYELTLTSAKKSSFTYSFYWTGITLTPFQPSDWAYFQDRLTF
jgi:hypothetical protein